MKCMNVPFSLCTCACKYVYSKTDDTNYTHTHIRIYNQPHQVNLFGRNEEKLPLTRKNRPFWREIAIKKLNYTKRSEPSMQFCWEN